MSFRQADFLTVRNRSPSSNQEKIPLILVVPQSMTSHFSDQQIINNIVKESRVDEIRLIQTLEIVEFQDGLISIIHPSTRSVLKAFRMVTSNQLLKELANNSSEPFEEVKILIPDQMVRTVIGQNGRSVSKVQESSHTLISVLRNTPGLDKRQVKIEGKSISSIENAVEQIYTLITERKLSPEGSYKPAGSSLSFVLPQNSAGYLIGKRGNFTKQLKFDYNIELKIYKDPELSSRDTDTLAIISGSYRDMKSCIPKVIKNLEECMIKSDCQNSSLVKIQIPASMSHKIIGPSNFYTGGNMVREIYQRSEGARIKILSDRESEKRLKNTILTIEGSLPSRQQAAVLIYKQMEKSKVNPTKSSRRNGKSRSRSFDTTQEQEYVYLCVPENLVSRLIGKNGENVKMLMDRSNSRINFEQRNSKEIVTPDNGDARLCKIMGSRDSIGTGVRLLLENIIKLEE